MGNLRNHRDLRRGDLSTLKVGIFGIKQASRRFDSEIIDLQTKRQKDDQEIQMGTCKNTSQKLPERVNILKVIGEKARQNLKQNYSH